MKKLTSFTVVTSTGYDCTRSYTSLCTPVYDSRNARPGIDEWHEASSFNVLELKWKQYQRKNEPHGYFSSSLNTLCFNVRGLDLRWGEVCLLVKQHLFDILVVGEVGCVDFALMSATLSNHNVFYQSGENAHGGVLVMVRKDISAVRVSCSLPSICALDLQFDQTIRLIPMYAPESKTRN
ncbi:unnamed protein product [Rotaria magnacalcarata]|uniref:Uncharacterized protein n=1 Tax=Rotaria magnacalcarata TaxID=392030 RepID=A0A820AZH1_9BILA|nr:unnamed protein product [Rotaria magnacalcarata]